MEKENRNKNNVKSYIRIFVLVIVAGILIYGFIGTKFTIEDSIFKISGLQGKKIELDEINSVELKDSLPTIKMRTFGFSMGGIKKGIFSTEEYGSVSLYLQNSSSPFIYIFYGEDDKVIIINSGSTEKTKSVYNELLSAIE